jgi:hypothetical protein
MMQSSYANNNEQEPSSDHPQLVGEGQHLDKMQGHWVLARAGKRVLRPGGLEPIPRSRHNPQFNQNRLPRPLQRAGIRYRHAAELGGLRHARRDSTNTAWRNASFRGFADYMQTPEFEEALDQLIHWAQKRRTAIMCAEAVPWRCHRSMIGDALLARGIRVEEIASRTRTRPHTLTPWALVRRKRVSYPASLKPTKAVGGRAA